MTMEDYLADYNYYLSLYNETKEKYDKVHTQYEKLKGTGELDIREQFEFITELSGLQAELDYIDGVLYEMEGEIDNGNA